MVCTKGARAAALRLPVFTGNHDFGRLAWIIRAARPDATDDEVLKRVMLGNAMMFLLRGVPVVYYGDEQGFVGHGIDQDARQDLFASRVASYNDQTLLGSRRRPRWRISIRSIRCTRRSPVSRSCARSSRRCVTAGRSCARMARARLVRRIAPLSDGRELVVAFNTSTCDGGRRRSKWKHLGRVQVACAAPARPKPARPEVFAWKFRR